MFTKLSMYTNSWKIKRKHLQTGAWKYNLTFEMKSHKEIANYNWDKVGCNYLTQIFKTHSYFKSTFNKYF